MAEITTAQITALTTPTLLVQADTDGCRVLVHKEQAHSIYLGGANVTTANGFLFDHDGTVDISLPANAKLYAVSTSGTETCYVMKIGNAS
jgi:hypothetical protein